MYTQNQQALLQSPQSRVQQQGLKFRQGRSRCHQHSRCTPSPIRALTITAIHPVQADEAYEQVDLFTAPAAPKKEKQERLEGAMDKIRKKYGDSAIVFGAVRPEKEADPLP